MGANVSTMTMPKTMLVQNLLRYISFKAANFSRTGSGFEPCIYRFRKDLNPFWYGTQSRLIQYKCLKSRRAGPTYCMDGLKTYKRYSNSYYVVAQE